MTASVACRRRLDPFQLPTATTGRFVLLMLLTLTGSADTSDWYFSAGPAGWSDQYHRCDAAANSPANTLAPNSVTGNYLGCVASVDHGRFGKEAAAVMVVMLVIIAVYILSGRALIWWRKLVSPPSEDLYPGSVAEVQTMIGEAGLRRAPTVLINLYRDGQGGRVFGCFGRYYLRLNVSVLRGSDAESVSLRRALVRHELAHLRNRDVDVTGLTIAAGRVFAVLVFVPLVVLGFSRHSPYLGQMLWRLAIVLVLVIVVRAAVIRSREHYADVAASHSAIAEGEPCFLAGAFPERQLPTLGLGLIGRLVRWLAALVRMHPSGQRRSSVVTDPGLLLTLGVLDALAIGLTLGFSITYLSGTVALLLGATYGRPLAVFLLGTPAIGALVAGLWRATLRALATQTELPTGTVAGVGFWAGLLLGEILMRPFGAHWPALFVADPVLGVIEAVSLLVGCLIFTRWSVGAAAAWLPAARGRSLRPTLAGGQLVGALAFSGVLAVWENMAIGPGLRSNVLAELLLALDGPYSLVLILLATAFPLGAALWRPTVPVPRAVWLDMPDAALPAPRLRVGAVLIPQLAVLGTALVVELLVHDGVAGLARTVAAAHGWAAWSWVVVAMEIAPTIVIVPLVLALTSTPTSAGLGSAHAVLAATLSSFFTVFVVTVVGSGGSRVGWIVFPINLILAEGFTLCLAPVLLAVIYMIRWLLRRLRRGSRRQWPADQIATDRPPRGPAWPLRWSFVLVVLAMLFTASYGWFGATLLSATFRPPPVAVPAPSPATRFLVPTAVVCSRDATLLNGTTWLGELLTIREAQLAVAAAASKSPALNAFGGSLAEGLRTADSGLTSRALLATHIYCSHVTAPTVQV